MTFVHALARYFSPSLGSRSAGLTPSQCSVSLSGAMARLGRSSPSRICRTSVRSLVTALTSSANAAAEHCSGGNGGIAGGFESCSFSIVTLYRRRASAWSFGFHSNSTPSQFLTGSHLQNQKHVRPVHRLRRARKVQPSAVSTVPYSYGQNRRTIRWTERRAVSASC